jgi:septal ring factor EnvC (AmiA/AmiB activator)
MPFRVAARGMARADHDAMAVGSKIKSLFWTEAEASAQRRSPAPAAPAAAPQAAPAPSPDLDGIAANVEQRLIALESGITAEQQRTKQRRQQRAQALESATAKVQHEIKTLDERVAHLRKQLAAVTAEAQAQDATEQQQLAAFVERSRAEATRLAALRDFIARGGSQ